MGAIVEVGHDVVGMIWPESVAPFDIHLVSLAKDELDIKRADEIYEQLIKSGKEVLYDDRVDVSAGAKFADSDLIGIPYRYVVSHKTLEQNSVEVKKRNEEKANLVKI